MAVDHPRVVNHLEVAEGSIALKIHLAAPCSSLH